VVGISLIVGLGNPGPDYAKTRHNAGQWLTEALCRQHGASLSPEKKFFGRTAHINVQGRPVRLLVPTTFMNRSGQAVGAMATFYRIPPEEILVVHDELDIPPGHLRVKQGGGHGGHNGLRDINKALGNNNGYVRLRIGIGHPGHASQVTGWVLKPPSRQDLQSIEAGIDQALRFLPDILEGHMETAMRELHSFKP
jgi:PTH1 family peptidyl-tRNA hydrolase